MDEQELRRSRPSDVEGQLDAVTRELHGHLRIHRHSRCRPAMRRVWRLCRRPDVFRSEFNRRHYHHGPYTKMSNAKRVALEKATAACKAEAKGMKFSWHWRKHQKYVQNCIIRSASKQGIDIWEIRRAVNLKALPSQDIDDWSFVFSRSRNR